VSEVAAAGQAASAAPRANLTTSPGALRRSACRKSRPLRPAREDRRPRAQRHSHAFLRAGRRRPVLYAHASRILHLEANPGNARALVQKHGDVDVWLNPPPIPLTTKEMDWVYDRPYQPPAAPGYGKANIPAYKMIRFSISIQRGCFGGCTFCSITEHEGRIIQNRSEDS
jgi:radical SAM superfamily enzyme YgiQ (UPF0313 family)